MTDRPELYDHLLPSSDVPSSYPTTDPPATRGDTMPTTPDDDEYFPRPPRGAQFIVRASVEGGEGRLPDRPSETSHPGAETVPDQEDLIPPAPPTTTQPAEPIEPYENHAPTKIPDTSPDAVVDELLSYNLSGDRNPNIEVRHTSRSTLLINQATAEPANVEQLTTRAEQAPITEGWTEVDANPSNRRENRKYFVDDPAAPRFFAKETKGPEDPREVKRPGLAATELLHADKIKAVVESDEAQAAATDNHFVDISLISPLVVDTDDSTNTETVVYPWQNGKVLETPDDFEETPAMDLGQEYEEVDDMQVALAALLEANGLSARDMNPQQFIIDTDANGDRHLYLIDTESIHEQSETPKPQPIAAYVKEERNIEVATVAEHYITMNRNHDDQSSVDDIVRRAEEGTLRENLIEVPYEDRQYDNRQYYRDPQKGLFFKVTAPPTGNPDPRERPPGGGTAELYRAAAVKAAIALPETQAKAYEYGFAGIDYVEPLAAILDIATGGETTIYRWQEGRIVPEVRTAEGEWLPSEPGTELHRLEAFGDALHNLFVGQGIISRDIHGGQFILTPGDGGRPYLHMIDAENFDIGVQSSSYGEGGLYP